MSRAILPSEPVSTPKAAKRRHLVALRVPRRCRWIAEAQLFVKSLRDRKSTVAQRRQRTARSAKLQNRSGTESGGQAPSSTANRGQPSRGLESEGHRRGRL
jgi:hypothetical protein